MKKCLFTLCCFVVSLTIANAQVVQNFVSPGPPIAQGQAKYLGCAHSAPQKINFDKYWNQVTPENGGKWGAAEPNRGVFTWADLDSAYKYAKSRGYPFKMHNLIWGSQQPSWIETLAVDTQLVEIKKWFKAVADRYPALDFIDVVNEPLHAPPSGPGMGNYINALGGSGVTGWDWVINSYKLSRTYFPGVKLLINDYNLLNDTAESWKYVKIINLLTAQGLLDGVGNQAHAPELYGTPAATIKRNLDIMATSGLPMYASELDIDGEGAIDENGVHVVNPVGDSIQLSEYKRVFPIIWQHPAIKGVTLWGYLTGHWRTAQGAFIAYSDGTERPSLIWLRKYVQSFNVVLPVSITAFNAFPFGNAVKINWTAINEAANSSYEIEKSSDAVHYTTLTRIQAAVSNATGKNYSAIDATPVIGKNYYRLVQIDWDDKKTYSVVKMVDISESDRSMVKVYPNPATSSFTIKTEAVSDQQRNVVITDLSGRVVKTFALSTSGVQNVITDGLQKGTYFIQITNNKNSKVTKIVIE